MSAFLALLAATVVASEAPAADSAPAAAPAEAAPAGAIPADVRAVLDAAMASGDREAVATVVRFAVQAHPAAAAEIRAVHQHFLAEAADRDAERAAAARSRIASAGPLREWDGQVELGASRATGSTDSLGLYGALSARRTGIAWVHLLNARAELQESNGRRTAERASASWQARRLLDRRLYLFGLGQYERDPFVGFDNRTTAGLGAGYSLLDQPGLHVEVEGGPAWRRTDARSRDDVSSLAARASLAFSWKPTPRLEFKQNGSFYLDRDNGSGQALSALDVSVIGPLRVRLSYELRFERDILRDVRSLDTTSRATFVYGF
jgi:putative salt-induced outer membrane protein